MEPDCRERSHVLMATAVLEAADIAALLLGKYSVAAPLGLGKPAADMLGLAVLEEVESDLVTEPMLPEEEAMHSNVYLSR